MNIKEIAGTVTAVVTLMGLGYAAALKGGWVVDRAIAADIAQQQITSESVERMEFQLEYKLSELRRYYAIQNKTPADLVQIKELEAQIESLRRRIAKARGQE